MILFIVIPIAIITLIVFAIRNTLLFKKTYAGPFGTFPASTVQTYNVLHSAPNMQLLEVSPNFFTYTGNLILKLVHFIVFALISYFCRDIMVIPILLTGLYGAFTAVAWITYKHRRNYYNDIPQIQKKAFTPIIKASICMPIYQSLILLLLLIV